MGSPWRPPDLGEQLANVTDALREIASELRIIREHLVKTATEDNA